MLVNNAGVALDGFDASIVEKTLGCNYFGTLRLTGALLPLMQQRDGARIVNVSSMIGKLNKYPPELEKRFRGAKDVEDITLLMNEFNSAVASGNHDQRGWPSTAYGVSKAGVTGMSKVLGQQTVGQKGSLLLNACCPGYVNTDMSKGRGRLSPDRGAQTPVKLALGDIGNVSGEFWEREEISSW